MIIQWTEIWRLAIDLNISEDSQNCSLITWSLCKNVHFSSNSYNSRKQPNIAMKFAEYVARILLCKYGTFNEKNNSRDIEFFLGVYFFGAPCTAMYPHPLIFFCQIIFPG